MPLSILIAVLAAAEPSTVSLAAPGLKSVGASADLVTFYSDHFSQQLTLRGLRVVTASEIESMLGFERQKQLLGCSDAASSCMAELANALGVDALVTGSLGKFGDTYQVNLKILSASDAKPLSARSLRVEGDKALLDGLTSAAAEMAPEVFTGLRRPVPEAAKRGTGQISAIPASPAPSAPGVWYSGPRTWFWAPAAVGLLSTVGAFVFNGTVEERRTYIDDATFPGTDVHWGDVLQAAEQGKEAQLMRNVLIGVAVAGFAGSGALLAFGGPGDPQPTAAVVPGGAVFGVVGVLP